VRRRNCIARPSRQHQNMRKTTTEPLSSVGRETRPNRSAPFLQALVAGRSQVYWPTRSRRGYPISPKNKTLDDLSHSGARVDYVVSQANRPPEDRRRKTKE